MRLLYICTAILVLCYSCDDTFNLNSEWSDITIVYGLLNQSDTAHYIKINKAFLGEGNAYDMAKEADSIQYADELNVELLEYVLTDEENPYSDVSWERTDRDPIIFTRTDEIEKDSLSLTGESGTFGTQVNYLYKSTEDIYSERKYVLQVIVPDKDEIVASETFLIGDLYVELPRPNTDGTFNSKITMHKYLRPYTTTWQAAIYGKIYEPVLRFRYLEITDDKEVEKYIDIEYPTQVVESLRMPDEYQGEELDQVVGGEDFYFNVGEKIDVVDGVRRKAIALDFIYKIGNSDLNYYISSSESSNTEENSYSNITNGKGIYASRYTYIVSDKEMSDEAIDSLAYGYYTKDLNFANYLGQWK